MGKLTGKGNLAHEIVQAVCVSKDAGKIVEDAKLLLDIALNHEGVLEYERAKIVGKICWKFGLEPPDDIIELMM